MKHAYNTNIVTQYPLNISPILLFFKRWPENYQKPLNYPISQFGEMSKERGLI
jgi:hypothetical protein